MVPAPMTAKAQETPSKKATPETLRQLLPKPPEGFERALGPAAEGKDGPWAQAMYVLNGEQYREGKDGEIRILPKGSGQVAFEVEISGVTEEERKRVLGQMDEAPPRFEIATEEHKGHAFYVITDTEREKSYLYLFTGPFQVYMEGNADPAHLRAALKPVDAGTLGQYRISNAN